MKLLGSTCFVQIVPVGRGNGDALSSRNGESVKPNSGPLK